MVRKWLTMPILVAAAVASTAALCDEANDPPSVAVSLASLPPSVVSTFPRCGDTAVAPGPAEISVTFSKEMKVTGHCWSWCGVTDDAFPERTAPTRFLDDKRTCVMTVSLQPEKTYAIWINTDQYHSFQDPQGHTAVPYLLVFRTEAAP
jgi:RNA polymerase sigma-70 factor (ECF subfamily)